jgi:hypothetical protein
MGVRGKEGHLTLRVATIGAVCVGLDKLSDGEAIRCFTGGNGGVLAHELVSLRFKNGSGFEERLDRVSATFTVNPGAFESSPGPSSQERHRVLALCGFRGRPFSPNRFGFWFLLAAFYLCESDKNYPIGPKHLYYQINRGKVSEWSCVI